MAERIFCDNGYCHAIFSPVLRVASETRIYPICVFSIRRKMLKPVILCFCNINVDRLNICFIHCLVYIFRLCLHVLCLTWRISQKLYRSGYRQFSVLFCMDSLLMLFVFFQWRFPSWSAKWILWPFQHRFQRQHSTSAPIAANDTRRGPLFSGIWSLNAAKDPSFSALYAGSSLQGGTAWRCTWECFIIPPRLKGNYTVHYTIFHQRWSWDVAGSFFILDMRAGDVFSAVSRDLHWSITV